MWNSLSKYLEGRAELGKVLYDLSINQKMKSFIKDSVFKIKNPSNDLYNLEEKWVRIYRESIKSEFYPAINDKILSLPKSRICIEYGCSIGTVSKYLSEHSSIVFGLDKSFSAIRHAKQSSNHNVEYVISEILVNPFEKDIFDFVVALNILELVEPKNLLDLIAMQMREGFLLLSDPYDYDRGQKTVSNPLNEFALRETLEKCGFNISEDTSKPSYVQWDLEINPRTRLHYLCDLVVARKSL